MSGEKRRYDASNDSLDSLDSVGSVEDGYEPDDETGPNCLTPQQRHRNCLKMHQVNQNESIKTPTLKKVKVIDELSKPKELENNEGTEPSNSQQSKPQSLVGLNFSLSPVVTVLDVPSSPILAMAVSKSLVISSGSIDPTIVLIILTAADVDRLCPAESKREVEEKAAIDKYLLLCCSKDEMTRYETYLSTRLSLKKKITTEYLIAEFIQRGISIPASLSSTDVFTGKDLGQSFVPIASPFVFKGSED